MDIISIINNVVFLDIETSGLNPINSEILEIGAIKIDEQNNISTFETLVNNKHKVPSEIFSLCKNLNQNDLDRAPALNEIKKDFLNFIEDKTIICHNKKFEEMFINYHIGQIDNKFIDSMELAGVLEPFHREFNLDYLKKNITKNKDDEKHRALSDVKDTIDVVNALILRFKDKLEKENKLTLYPLTFDIDSYLNKFALGNWDWSHFINNANYDLKEKTNTVYEEEKQSSKKDDLKEEEIFKLLGNYKSHYEELLKEGDIWTSKKGFIYEFRQGQYDLTKLIRETFNKNVSNIACIEAPTGIGKSVGYLLPAVLEARYAKKRIIVSTATKELQVQLIDKDLPNVINSLGLSGKVSYGYIKGKNNYICKSKFYEYKKDYDPENPTYTDVLSIIIIENLIKDGKYGDIEEINYWLLENFKELQSHIHRVTCDVDLCKPKKCHENCLYKKRVEELKDEDITVVNHSLLARWPYVDEKPMENIIVDEAHNLVEKGYDFFSGEIEYNNFKYFLKEIYPSEFSGSSKYYRDIKDKQKRKVKPIDRFYTEIKLDREIKQKISHHINFIFEKSHEVLDFGLHQGYSSITNYDLNWEINLQQDDEVGILYRDNEYVKLTYKPYTQIIKSNFENILSNIKQILVLFDRNIDEDLIDKESEVYKYGKSKIKDLEDMAVVLGKFLEGEQGDLVARIATISSKSNNFILQVVPLNLADLFRENILSTLNCGIFLSATLSVDNKMDYFTNTLGIDQVDNTKKIIEPIYNYKNRVEVIRTTDIGGYKGKEFIPNMADNIQKYVEISNSNVLSLFNSRKRLEDTYDVLQDNLIETDINVYMNKKGIKSLKTVENKSVVLGSKGCFEGVDVPGDNLVCVTLDKLPNLKPTDPLYFSIMTKFNKTYFDVNYPQMVIKVKQALGRLLRSKYDYGVFVLFNMGSNIYTNKRLEKNLHGCVIKDVNSNNIQKYIYYHLKKSRKEVITDLITNILKNKDKKQDNLDLVDYINNEIKQHCIKASVKYYQNQQNKLLVQYYNIKYIVEIDKICKN